MRTPQHVFLIASSSAAASCQTNWNKRASKNTKFLRVSGKRAAAVLTCSSLGRHAERAHGEARQQPRTPLVVCKGEEGEKVAGVKVPALHRRCTPHLKNQTRI